MNTQNFTDTFKALGDNTRYKLVKLLMSKKDICVSELADEIDISVAGVSQQLKILEKANIIERIRDGQKICYKIDSNNPQTKKVLSLIKKEG
ncbi:TPA: ArsR family transcriptional regulator [Candidatus Saccharibacteria bacterium]|nr:ArsR family transcriptional regulator [Candidatus Saccharibacteria bacterium]HIO87270.1 ArsR family transcriptional regulator [Candidatus Saccharibacteria bacterium]